VVGRFLVDERVLTIVHPIQAERNLDRLQPARLVVEIAEIVVPDATNRVIRGRGRR
jgi:hypothetical protein